MVAIVSGMRAGLDLASGEVLGFKDVIGGAVQGSKGQGVNVNIATGQVVLQDRDDLLVARGEDAPLVRNYNSDGSFNDDNGDGWTTGVTMLRQYGGLNTVGSAMVRVAPDAGTAVYNWVAERNLYVSSEGSGAYDTIEYIAADRQFEWRDGTTGTTERFEPSGQARLLARRDTAGNTVSYAYGTNGFLSAVTTANGDGLIYDYTGNNLMQVRSTVSGVTTTRARYGYDGSNRLTSVTIDLTPGDNSISDGKVYQTTYTYDGATKRVASITQSDGTSVAFTYVDTGGGVYKLASVRDGANQTTTFTYGVRFTTVTDPLGLVTRYDYNGSNLITAITGPATGGVSAVRQFTYDAWENVTAVTDGEGRTVTYQYDNRGNQVLQVDAAGDTVMRTFDVRNQLLTEKIYSQPDPDGTGPALPSGALVTRNVHDDQLPWQLRFTISATGRVTEHRYDQFGQQVASITYAGTYSLAGLAEDAVPTEASLVAWTAGQDLAATQRVDLDYNGRGQLQARTSYARVAANGTGIADGTQSVEHFVYDAAGLLLQTVSATNGTTSYSYDGLGRALTATDALGQVAVTQYDDAGRRTVVTQANGLVTTSTFDAVGRRTSVLQSNAGTALGETKYFYDADNRLRMTQDPTGVRSWILYDEAGRKTADVDGNGSMTEYMYDRSDRVAFVVTRGNAVNTALLVDANGSPVVSATVGSVRPASSAADFVAWRQYDSAGRLVREATSTGTGTAAMVTERRYDGASRLVQVIQYATPASTASNVPGFVALPSPSSQDRVTRNFYDDDGRLTGTLDGEGYLKRFRYTGAGQLSETISYATASDTAQRAAGTLAQLTPAAAAADIRTLTLYDAKGLAIATLDGEGYLTENVYDASGNLTQGVRYATRVAGTPSAGSTVAALRPASTAQDQATTRSYDLLNRVVQETDPQGVVTRYAYDVAGNLVSTVRAAGTGEVRTLLARYDVQGRLTGELSAQGAALLTGGQTQAQVDAIWAQYGTTHVYDAASRRISSTDPLGNRTLFFYTVDGDIAFSVNALGEVKETRYDARGRVTDTIAYGKRIATTGWSGGLVTSAFANAVATIADATVDSRVSVTYTRDSRVASTTDAEGNVTSSAFNAFGEEISRQVGGAGTNLLETYTVDRRGQRTGTIRDATGVNAASTAVYDAFGRLVRSVDANGNLREQVFDRLGRVVTTRDPLNAMRSTSYDAFGRVLTQTDALGNATAYSYDAAARSITVRTPEGVVTTTLYTRHGQVQSITDGNGQVTSYRYDADGNLLQTTTPLTATANGYDALDHLVEATDANGNKVAYSYDAAGRVLTRRVDPNGLNLLTTYGYDAKGQRVTVTDGNGVVTTMAFDRNGRTTRVTVDPTGLNLQTVYSYDARGNVLTLRAPAGTVTQYTYDALGRRTQERIDPSGLNLQRTWTYDRNGNAIKSTDANGNVTRHAYDADDRLVFTLDPAGGLRQTIYDAEGHVVKAVAYATPLLPSSVPATPTVAQLQALVVAQPALDVVEHRVYDKDGRLAATVDGAGAVVRYAYDGNGNVVARTAYATRISLASWTPGTVPVPTADATQDAVVRTLYDGLNRAIYTMDGVGAVVALAYDGNGNEIQRTAYATAIPTNTNLTSSAIAGALAVIANPARDAMVRNTYDAAGRLTWTVDGTGAVVQNAYDGNGNLVRRVAYATPVAMGAAASSVAAAAGDRAAAMAYDRANRLVFRVDALRGVTEQVFDADGHVVRRTAYANAIASVPTLGASTTVDAIRSLLRADPANDRSTLFGFDAAGRQSVVVDAVGAVTQTEYDGTGNAVTQTARARTIGVSALGASPTLEGIRALVLADPANDRTVRNAYDAVGRLVFTVDAVGAVKASQYDAVGRMTRSTRYATALQATSSYTAGAIGNALRADPARDETEAFAYNAAGQLIAATDALGAVETCTFDALGNKLSFTDKKNFTWNYTYDAAGRLLSETTPQVQLTSAALAANGSIALTADAQARIVTQLAYDALGNLVQRTEAAGRPEQRTTRYEYDALGRQVRVVFPTVGVYDAPSDALGTNGASGVASRVETQKALETRTFYDTLGNAVANRDVGDALDQKVYDALGRVTYEIDVLGYVTGYARNAFGDVTSLTRYAVATTLANANVNQAPQAATKAMVDAALAGIADHGKDRTLLSTYDRVGRLLESTQPTVFMNDAASGQTGSFGAKTRNVYDAFGQLVQEQKLRIGDTWTTTTHYFDPAGRERATVDAMGYLTERSFDLQGNVTGSSEYANAVAPGWTASAYTKGASSQDDRVTTCTYDVLNRKRSETRARVEASVASDGTSGRADLTTSYEYDAVGNQTRVVDAGGNPTITYYDALGRVTAVAAPPRSSTGTGVSLTPLTSFLRDAYGNVVARTDYAGSASGITASAFTAPLASADDRTTLALHDKLGHSIQSTDAMGNQQFVSYDAYGHVAKQWQGVTGNDGVTRTVYEQDAYDKLGRLTATRTPAAAIGAYTESGAWQVNVATATSALATIAYNAFGEVTAKGNEEGVQEYFEYDNAGRLWRTNSGDGVDRINLYDGLGDLTSEIRSAGSGLADLDIKTFANAQAAAANPNTRRVDISYDALGRVTKKVEAARQEVQGGAVVQQQFTTQAVLQNAADHLMDTGSVSFGSTNKVALTWNNLSPLGGGDIKVYIEYRTSVIALGGLNDTGGPRTAPGTAIRSYMSGMLDGEAAASGTSLEWLESNGTDQFGISDVTRIVVYKRDRFGNWLTALDQAPGYGSNEMLVAAPPDPAATTKLELRAAGSAGDTGWWQAGLSAFGNLSRFDAGGLLAGNYEYRVSVSPSDGSASRVSATGIVSISQPPLNAITTPLVFGGYGMVASALRWISPGSSYQQVFRYRASGSTGAWSTLALFSPYPGYDGVDASVLGAGTYQFELLWSVKPSGTPSAHATGTFTVVPPVPSAWVPPVNLPPITGVQLGTGLYGATFLGQDESHNPIYSGGTRVPALAWSAAGATTARYRVAGGSWNSLAINSDAQYIDESMYKGTQLVLLNGIPPGTYEVQVLASSPGAQATASLTIYPETAGYYATVDVQVARSVPVVAYYDPVYETRYATRLAERWIWVNDPPYISGHDEAGNPVWVYPAHLALDHYDETYSYRVQVGQTPVYARDENGNIVYQTVWVTEQQPKWVPPTTRAPTMSVTTPAYTAGYWTQAQSAQYGVSTTTVASSAALSTNVGSTVDQGVVQSGDIRWQRPTVLQKTDRWGNVVEITDPRAASWKTTYRYNARNQLVQQTLPDGAITSLYYDALGRQVAVRDANGHVNGQVYDAAGNLVKEVHADGGVVTNTFNAFGERTSTKDAMANIVGFSHDKLGHLLSTTRAAAGVYAVSAGYELQSLGIRHLVDSWSYDQLGRKLSQTNGNGEQVRYTYDLAGNLVETRQPLGQTVRASYDAQGRKIAEVDANGIAATWTYDYFGQLTRHVDLGGNVYAYRYDNARQLTQQSSTGGQSLVYAYDAAGQVAGIRDLANDKTTTYVYDLSGRKVRERVVQAGITYQDNNMAYDARGNLRDVADARAHVSMAYDAVGNRTVVSTVLDYLGTGGETISGSSRYYRYDAMNRQIVVDGVDAAGNLGTQGHAIAYDLNGNRTRDTYYGNVVTATGNTPVITGYNEDGSATYTTTPRDFTSSTGYTTETYSYDHLNRLQAVEKDGMQIDVRYYDGADRVVQSGPAGALMAKYADLVNQGLTPDQMNGKETRVNRYDANGRLLHQRILKNDNTQKVDIYWDQSQSPGGYTANGYDAAGNVLGYVVENHEAGVLNKFTTVSMKRFDAYQAGTIHGESSKLQPGDSTQVYDGNGFLVGVQDSTQPKNNRTFVNDASGKALYVNQAGNIQRQLVVNGEVLGLYGVGVSPTNPASGYNNNPNFANVVDFDFGYARVSANYPSASPGAYTIRVGDTLQSIAQTAYGDSSLWYRIADANGLASPDSLKVGQTLNIPNRVSTINNNATTFKPYDPSKIEGDKTPNLAMPKPKEKSFFGMLLMIVVAIVVTIYTAGAMAAAMNAVASGTSTWSAGLAALGGGSATVGGTVVSLAPGVLGSVGATAVASAAVGGAVGSVASQMVGMVTGAQDRFDWKSVGLSALSAGMTSGLGAPDVLGKATSAVGIATHAALANAAIQGVGVVTGLQSHFDWRGVAAAGVGAGVGQMVGSAAGLGEGLDTFDQQFGKRFITGLAAGAAAAAMQGGRVVVQQVAVDAFGNALGQSLADAATTDQRRATEAVQLSDAVYGAADAAPAPYTGTGLRYGAGGETGFQISGKTAVQWTSSVERGVEAASAAIGADQPVKRDVLYRAGADDPYEFFTASGGASQFDPRRYSGPSLNLQGRIDRELESVAGWSKYVGEQFDSAILDAASSGIDGWGRFLTGARVVATASSDAISGTAALGRLIVSPEAREAFAANVRSFLQDPAGNVSRAFDAWTSKAWHEQLEDVYKVFQGGAAGIGLAGKAKGLLAVRVLDEFASLGPNTQRVVSAYQSAYNDAAAAFRSDLAAGNITKPGSLNFNTWAGNRIDAIARDEMLTFKQINGIDDLIVNQRLYVPDGIKGYRIPDLMVPGERTVIDGTIGNKSLTTPQIQDFFASGKIDRVILVAPNKNPVIITLEQYLRSK